MRWVCLLAAALAASGVLNAAARVTLGNEVLAAGDFKLVRGKRIGLLTNPSGTDHRGRSTIDILRQVPGVQLVALFGPEHGIYGKIQAGHHVADGRDSRTGLPVHSLYGATRKPTPDMLRGLDALVYDLQDTGCRSYTFISTLGLAMEACGEAGVEFIVLDRPNPLGGERVEGPMVEPGFRSFVGQWDIPYIYGLTCGELAQMIQGEGWIKSRCQLTVVPMKGWSRSMVWRDTGLRWVPSSPNIPRADSPLYCASTGLFGEIAGGSGATIGIGFGQPFECVVAPWLDAAALSRQMHRYRLPGVQFVPHRVDYRGKEYAGVELRFTAPSTAPLVAINLYLLDAIRLTTQRNLLGEAIRAGRNFAMFDKVNGTDATRKALRSGRPPSEIVRSWSNGEAAFRERRQRYLLYSESSRHAPWVTPIPSTEVSPGDAARTQSVGSYREVTIVKGDTLSRIARDLGVSLNDIAEANPGIDIDRLSIGQKIRVPPRRDGH